MRCLFTSLALLAVCTLATGVASAQLSNYSQDFEALDRNDFDALSNDGWLTFAAGINGNASFPDFGAGPFGTPNNIVAPFQAVISETTGGDPPAGAQGLTILSDYASDLHQEPQGTGTDPRDLVINVFQEQIISAGDIGKSVTFSFLADGNAAPPSGGATAEAFLITLDPNAGFSRTNDLAFDTTNLADGALLTGSLSLDITDPLLQGQILQFGFRNTASDFEGSAVDYDNVLFSVVPEPTTAAMIALAGVAGLARRRR